MKTNNPITIVPFSKELAEHFDIINRQWIEHMFTVEEVDDRVLKHPEEEIINKGGYIWFAQHQELGIVGACALLKKAEGTFELTKMGVLESARGLKVGETLLKYVIDKTKEMNLEYLFLLTNARCEAAIHLYEKNGFNHDSEVMRRFGQSYQRCDVAMRFQA